MPGKLLEWVAGVPQVPHLQRRIAVVVVRNEELCGLVRVPCDFGAPGAVRGVAEVDHLLLLLQIPDDGEPGVGRGAENLFDLALLPFGFSII